MTNSTISYKDAGVDIDAGESLVKRILPAVKSTMRPEVLAGVGGFASLVGLPEGMKDPVLVSGTDGVGTKLKIAIDAGIHDTVGIDLVAMCANDVLATGAQPLFFLDYFACGRLDTDTAAAVIGSIAEGCRQAGAALVGGETAEMPGMYADEDYDLAGFVVGVVDRDRIISGDRVQEGDALIGLPSSGVHSNGFSLVRAVLQKNGLGFLDPLPGFGCRVADELLRPTRIYVKPVLDLISRVEVRAIAHITGGGLVDNVHRTLPQNLGAVIEATWPVPPIFRWLKENGPVARQDMLRTFNMGIGMTIALPRDQVEEALALLKGHGLDALQIGEIVAASDPDNRVIVEGDI